MRTYIEFRVENIPDVTSDTQGVRIYTQRNRNLPPNVLYEGLFRDMPYSRYAGLSYRKVCFIRPVGDMLTFELNET